MAAFAERHGIRYPLLADEGSEVIRALGLLNEEAAPAIAGIPHPGVFVLDQDGIVTEKRFYASYRERDTGVGILERALGIATPRHGPETAANGPALSARAWFDAESYAWGQRLWLSIELTVAPGYHINGPSAPEGYIPLALTIGLPERVVAGELRWPATRPLELAGLGERLEVYEGTVRVDIPITFMVADAGELEVAVRLTYQACTDVDCLPPESLSLALRLPEVALIERPKPS